MAAWRNPWTATNPWLAIGRDAVTLGIEASTVIGLRTMQRAMAGPGGSAASDAEARRMVDEKVASAMQLQMAMMTGGLGFTPATATKKAIRHYTRKVRANRRRLAG